MAEVCIGPRQLEIRIVQYRQVRKRRLERVAFTIPPECFCMADYYMTPSSECVSCGDIEGVACTEPGLSLATLPLQANVWRLSSRTIDVVE